ncbi:hypothetical protein SAY87_021318 [Trapa incisa]|uniref:Uncharacterized protein n=2 Tax=Trapa TaxID=22665 RepID=A0AAN7MYC2_TRANT|nr:hypothetical protein SAY87_021318 [Trapa incisa]KAK4804385.1 hypothetical protein SAY86_004202 [Trapa natans]
MVVVYFRPLRFNFLHYIQTRKLKEDRRKFQISGSADCKSKGSMEGGAAIYSNRAAPLIGSSAYKVRGRRTECSASLSPVLLQIRSMASQKPLPSATKTISSRKGSTTVFPLGEPGPRPGTTSGGVPVKLLTRVEQLKLLTKAEKAGLLSAAEKFGFSLSSIERLGLLSKAEELGVLSAATDPGTPAALSTLSLGLLLLGPASVYAIPEDYLWQVALQSVVALVCVVGGSAAFAASSFVSNLQKLR